jgi:hypothetical protein
MVKLTRMNESRDLVGPWSDGELAQRAQRLREDDAKLAKLTEKYPDWHIFKVAGAWGAILKAHELARTGNTLEELETAILRPDDYGTASYLDPDDPQRDGIGGEPLLPRRRPFGPI